MIIKNLKEYKQKREERRLKGEVESTTLSDDDSSLASTLSHTTNSNELFNYPKIENTFDYEEQVFFFVNKFKLYQIFEHKSLSFITIFS